MNTQELGDKNSITHSLENQYPLIAGIDNVNLTTEQINGGSFNVDTIIAKFGMNTSTILDLPSDYGNSMSEPTIEEQVTIEKIMSDTKESSFTNKYKH